MIGNYALNVYQGKLTVNLFVKEKSDMYNTAISIMHSILQNFISGLSIFGLLLTGYLQSAFAQYSKQQIITSGAHYNGTVQSDSTIILKYAIKKPALYSYTVQSTVSQSMGEMIDFLARTSANTEMTLSTESSVSSPYKFHYSYGPGTVTLNGLSMAGIPDTTFVSSSPLIPEIIEFINSQGKVVARNGIENGKNSKPKNSEQLMQTLSQGARFFLLEFPTQSIALQQPWTIIKSDTINTNTNEGSSTIILRSAIDCKVARVVFNNGIRTALIDCASNSLGFQGNVQQQGIAMSIDGEGAAKGTYSIELHTGLPTEAQLSMEYQLRMAATGQENAIIPVTMTMDTKYTRTQMKEVSAPSLQKKTNNQIKK